ncbi:hypothetical protein F4776DRAFT_266914 [Hypoxylon sp. NC0597]|nr:hypothetical protein F4776DRAFT_266914 [Hypoxylon sp. NC0597]
MSILSVPVFTEEEPPVSTFYFEKLPGFLIASSPIKRRMPQAQVMRRASRVDLALPTDPCSVAAGPGSPFFSLHIPEPTSPRFYAHPSKGNFEVAGLSRSTRWLTSCHQIPSVARAERLSPFVSMDRFHPLESMRSVIQNALPNVTVESIEPLPSCRLLRFFSVKISDGRTLALSLSPPPTMRLLRSERDMSISEALVTKWILEEVLESPIQVEASIDANIDARERIESQLQEGKPRIKSEGIRDSKKGIIKFLPILIVHSPSSTELGSPFNLFEQPKGVPVSGLSTPLTTSERKSVDLQRGQLVRLLSSLKSPNGLFGPVTAIINSHVPSTDLSGRRLVVFTNRGATSWRQAFHGLLEAVLRDAEDMAVTFSYEPIRGYFSRLGYVLDGVTTARLVVLDASDESNILLLRSSKPSEGGDKSLQSTPSRETRRSETKTGKPPDPQQPTISLTGFRDWSNCVFADPLFAEVFSRDPSSEFLRGFRRSPGAHDSRTENDEETEVSDDNFVEDHESIPIRLLLYECYHATVGVVKTFYRPGPNSSDREIAARRRLAAALKRLQEVDEEVAAGKRPRRPSANVEVWPIKKPKGDDDTHGPIAGGEGG